MLAISCAFWLHARTVLHRPEFFVTSFWGTQPFAASRSACCAVDIHPSPYSFGGTLVCFDKFLKLRSILFRTLNLSNRSLQRQSNRRQLFTLSLALLLLTFGILIFLIHFNRD